jgi:dihydroorotate dehydrogenase electron transfer subunit
MVQSESFNRPFTTRIKRVVTENEFVRTFVVDFNPDGVPVEIQPGQFIMVWVPGTDEVPMSVSFIGPGAEIRFTVQRVGDCTKRLFELQEGDWVGIRGPYGSSFKLKPGHAIFVSGGVGLASVMTSITKWVETNGQANLSVIVGFRSLNLFSYMDHIKGLLQEDENLFCCTDDGSYGFHGFTPTRLEQRIQELVAQGVSPNDITVYTCGPEKMMKIVYDICVKHNVGLQASLERMMRCGMGVCGLCAIDPLGVLVCKAGPVFPREVIANMEDFGKARRTMSGHKTQ